MLILKDWRQLLAKKLHWENRLIKVSRTFTNKVFQNFEYDEERLLPGFYYYAGLQIQVNLFSSYSAFLGKISNTGDGLCTTGLDKEC